MISPTCTVYLDGKPFADDKTSLENQATTVLGGLTVKWGRSTRLDQPGATTLTATIALPPEAPTAEMERIAPGKRIAVTATGQAAPKTSTTELAPTAWDSTLSINRTARTANLTQGTVKILMPPKAFPTSSDPAAWNTLPAVVPGQRFTVAIPLTVPPGYNVTVAPAYWSEPLKESYYPDATTSQSLGNRTVFRRSTLELSWVAPPSAHGTRVGLVLTIVGSGLAWKDDTNTWTQIPETWTDYQLLKIGATPSIRSDLSGQAVATVFDGAITSAVAKWDDNLDRPVLSITAADVITTLANCIVGSDPWPTETVRERLARIIAASGLSLTVVADPRPAQTIVRAQDADATGLVDLIKDAATSAGAILWPSAADGLGEFLHLEDRTKRKALYRLIVPATGPAFIEADPGAGNQLPAAALPRDGIQVLRDTTDLATQVVVKWESAVPDGDGGVKWESHEALATDTNRINQYGTRTLSVSTGLTSQAAAQELADYLLAQTAPGGWTIPGIIMSDKRPALPAATLMASLDASTRIGLPLTITDCADWIPGAPTLAVYLDGGTITRRLGHWEHELTLTRSTTATDSITWAKTPTALTWARTGELTWAAMNYATI
ncbi:hypothetical protein [Schaalia vaccimaxillae]|uniref:hypothetical protein n=1 Tax=Schaalia vaccimaxillae TaxID=183916 RepID=UPI0003B60142|nr:hypothetical protein [Schaalia vaccimaxillae]